MQRDILPTFCRHLSCIIQPHDPVYDSPEQTFPAMYADGDEIGPGLCIIVIAQTDGTAVISFDFSFVFTCPSTRRLAEARVPTI
jgi:hypothetical protein